MTRSLVKLGQQVAAANGADRRSWVPYLVLRLSFVAGVICGASAYPRVGLSGFFGVAFITAALDRNLGPGRRSPNAKQHRKTTFLKHGQYLTGKHSGMRWRFSASRRRRGRARAVGHGSLSQVETCCPFVTRSGVQSGIVRSLLRHWTTERRSALPPKREQCMRKRPKPSTKLGYPKLTSEQVGQFIVRMQAVRAYEEKLMLLIAGEEAGLSLSLTNAARSSAEPEERT